MARFQAAFLALCALITTTLAVTPMVVRGADFVNSIDGKRFQIIGVAYQPGGAAGYNPGADALSDSEVCMRDAILLQNLGVNAIRVYNLDPEVDHTDCASIFNAAGIYLIIDVNSPLPNESLNRVAPWESYNSEYIERTFKTVAAFWNFPNTLGYFSGNEVINEDSHGMVPAYLRAVTRDIKEFIHNHGPREIPVGYSAADVRPLLEGTFNYLSCELSNDTASKIDFFGLNSYAWCGESNMEDAEYDVLIEDFAATPIPIFMSEYGCNEVTPRVFTEVGALYSTTMMGVFSGGVVYEYSQEPNNYGLVEIDDDGDVEVFEDFHNFAEQLAKLDLDALTAQNRSAMEQTPQECSLDLLAGANFTETFGVPERVDGIDDLVQNGVDGDFPEGVIEWTETTSSHSIVNEDGSAIDNLELKILGDDESNLPSGSTIGTGEQVDIGEGNTGVGGSSGNSSSGGSGSGSGSGDDEGAAVRVGGVQIGALTMAALGLGFLLL